MRAVRAALAAAGLAWLLAAGVAHALPPRAVLGPASAVEVLEDGTTVTTVTHPDGRVTTRRGMLPKPARSSR